MRKPGYIALAVLMAATIALTGCSNVTAGLNALTWDEDIYNFACQRAQAIVSDFSHNGCGNYGENIALNSAGSAYRIHMQWKILHWKKVKTVVERYPAMPMDRRQKQL